MGIFGAKSPKLTVVIGTPSGTQYDPVCMLNKLSGGIFHLGYPHNKIAMTRSKKIWGAYMFSFGGIAQVEHSSGY